MGAGVPITGCCGEARRMPSDRRTGPRADVPSAETCKRPPGSTKPRSNPTEDRTAVPRATREPKWRAWLAPTVRL